ncbi:MAG: leukotriene A4 hydrolase C-terminal domain-containing protein, partial [Bacteroidota bacterium]
ASFPFGGMENPRLTFATPTILAGDRSLVSLVAHELAHSWSGNLVTNETWDDFWLNEGFTVYFENRIMEKVYGKEYSEMLALISKKQLEKEIDEMMPENAADTHLKLDLVGRDPDEGLTAIAYDKGYFFLRHLEESFGREQFDEFLKGYFTENAFKTVNTKKFLSYLSKNLTGKIKGGQEKAMPEAWIYEAGLPAIMPEVSSDKYDAAVNAAEVWTKGEIATDAIDTKDWKYQQYEFFLRTLPETLTNEQLAELDKAFGFSKSGNSEILGQWFLHVARNEYEPVYPTLKKFLMRVGRRKFIGPIYAELAKNEASKAWATEVYKEARPNYHFVSYGTIDKILGYK